jgi:hypothetical protein
MPSLGIECGVVSGVREPERRRSALAEALRRREEVVDADYEDVEEDGGAQVRQVNGRSDDDRADDGDEDQQFDDDCVVQGRVQGR